MKNYKNDDPRPWKCKDFKKRARERQIEVKSQKLKYDT